jgi:hypothetical protein
MPVLCIKRNNSLSSMSMNRYKIQTGSFSLLRPIQIQYRQAVENRYPVHKVKNVCSAKSCTLAKITRDTDIQYFISGTKLSMLVEGKDVPVLWDWRS